MTAAVARQRPPTVPWMQTESGGVWPILDPQPLDVNWRDVAYSLAGLPRFTGHTRRGLPRYRVGQHSCLAHDIVAKEHDSMPPDAALPALIHDAHESVINDQCSPVKSALRMLGAGEALSILKTSQDRAIIRAAGLPWPLPIGIQQAVHHADMVLLATERRDLMAPCAQAWDPMPDPLPDRIEPWSEERCEAEFLERLSRYIDIGEAVP